MMIIILKGASLQYENLQRQAHVGTAKIPTHP